MILAPLKEPTPAWVWWRCHKHGKSQWRDHVEKKQDIGASGEASQYFSHLKFMGTLFEPSHSRSSAGIYPDGGPRTWLIPSPFQMLLQPQLHLWGDTLCPNHFPSKTHRLQADCKGQDLTICCLHHPNWKSKNMHSLKMKGQKNKCHIIVAKRTRRGCVTVDRKEKMREERTDTESKKIISSTRL